MGQIHSKPQQSTIAGALWQLADIFRGRGGDRVAEQRDMLSHIHHALEYGELQLPVFPAVAQQATEMIGNPDTRLGDLAGLVETDAALAADLLRLVNSPAFCGGSPISSVRRAIAQIGFETFRTFLFTVLRRNMFPGSSAHKALSTRYFQQSLAVACTVSALRPWAGVPEDPFIYGLLHNIGRPCMLDMIERLQVIGDLPEDLNEETIAWLIEETYVTAGSALAKAWELPIDIVQVVRFHAHPDPTLDECHNATLTHVAMLLCRRFGLGYDIQEAVTIEAGPHMKRFKPGMAESLDAVMEEAWMLYGDMGSAFA